MNELIFEGIRMFGFFRPICPVDSAAKDWIEDRLEWLAEQFGLDVFTRRALVLPTSDFFPDPIKPTQASVRALLDRLCGYMEVEPSLVDLELFRGTTLRFVNDRGQPVGGAAGMYKAGADRTTIKIEVSQLEEKISLIGTLAHELAHQRLLGESRVARDIFDNELLTDLTVVFHGLGVFLANCPRHWESQFSVWPGTKLKKPEYMTPPMYGYALAHAAWLRGETKPKWRRYLDWGARSNLKQGLNYLIKTGDSTFKPSPLRRS